tara:strand:- start:23 stop:625 length:603 start_codon:yes stop_codon:yes gene_type:complete
MEKLTKRQSEILELIREFLQVTGFPPTRSEIASQFGFRSANAAEEHLRALARKGYINIKPGTSRGIRLTDGVGIPIIGKVAAGNPILSESNIQGRAGIDPNLFRPHADYLLKVRGMSMRDAGILEGDLIAVNRKSSIRSGQIIVARVNNEVTVKRFRRQASDVQLISENPEFPPITVDLKRDQFEVEGLAVGVIRNGKIY